MAAHTTLNFIAARGGRNSFRSLLLTKNEAKLRDNMKNRCVYVCGLCMSRHKYISNRRQAAVASKAIYAGVARTIWANLAPTVRAAARKEH